MLRLDLTPLQEGVHHVVLEPAPEALDLDPSQFSDIHVDVTLDYQKGRVLVSLKASARMLLECDRTLTTFQHPLEGTYTLLFVPPSFSRRSDEALENDEEIRLLEPGARDIELTDAVRDTLLLAVPTRRLAPGAEDIDIPLVYGAPSDEEADPVDPRWEALRRLRSDTEHRQDPS